ncbi:hypothetical membrane protein, conserved, flame shift [Thermococcus kodakarensis KOD1]|uniref:Hypothetical membrane protein, conserved, flame shift n=1 Tax=Thermococcus kodakarensis (strain ATCC BAA-918 / JCM 12380 / KOD1) TaxID=69014 RepID=Q5JEU3_THEKO|nr:hypothetical membrane protein, conserved, flame shift [Thermococcus kodakarensis KOD1]
MNPYFIFRILYGVFLGLAFVIGGILTATSKGEPGIGFRIGYTYLSERARERANRITGIGLIALGCYLCSPRSSCRYTACLSSSSGESPLSWRSATSWPGASTSLRTSPGKRRRSPRKA